jgi:predicted PurR-regulated permease PerM
VVILIAYFLLASGDSFRRKMVKLAGPNLSSKRITLETLNEISAQMQRFLLVQVVTSAIVGLATWLAFAWIGLQHAAVWGVAAGVTNLVPYIGGVFMAAGSALIGFMQFGTLEMALVVGGASSAIHAVVGSLLTPWLTSRANRMSPVTVFVGVLAWGWLWGVWGLLLGVPILTVVKAVCDRVDELNPVGELLGS